jgi:signal transduction histidine kinase/DNA-binding response OmpR family regulator
MAEKPQDRILIVESDPIISDLISRQALKAAGFQTVLVSDAAEALGRVAQLAPDVIIVNLSLPGLSGKDLMVALNSQNIDVPVIVLGSKGSEREIAQAFRLGAADYLLWPVREAEVITVVERALKQVRERRERDRLGRQLQQTNQELQQRVRELTTIFTIGKAVVSITRQSLLFEKILDGAARVTQSDLGWLLLRDDLRKAFILTAQKNLPHSLMTKLNEPWDDSISSLVATSGEPLSIQGEPLNRFKISALGKSALIMPIRVQKQVIGLLVVMRKKDTAYSPSDQSLLEAVCDYASISLVNARLFKEVEERAQSLQQRVGDARNGQKISSELLQSAQKEMRTPVEVADLAFDRLVNDPKVQWTNDQRQLIRAIQNQLQNVRRVVQAVPGGGTPEAGPDAPVVRLNEIVIQSVKGFQRYAQDNQLTLTSDLATESMMVRANADQVQQVLNGLLSNAIKYTNPGGRVNVRLTRSADGMAHIEVRDTGIGLDPSHSEQIFEGQNPSERSLPRNFGGLGIGLALIREMVAYWNGKIWVESQTGKGTAFHIAIPLYR